MGHWYCFLDESVPNSVVYQYKGARGGPPYVYFLNIFKATDLSPSKNLQEFDCFEDFFDNKYYPFSKATKRRSHLELYVFDKHIRPIFGQKTLAGITSKDLDLWMTA